MARPTETFELLRLLHRHGVDFIVVGMTAGVLQGVPAVTFDLDVVYDRRAENLERLLGALAELQAIFRDDPRRIAPNVSHLESSGHKLLETRLGDVDLLGTLAEDVGYDELLPDALSLSVEDIEVRVLGLRRLIEVKEEANREKDRAVLPLLRSTLERAERKR